MITVGVDPGMSGAIGLVDRGGGLVDCYDMPVVGGLVSIHGLLGLEEWDNGEFGPAVIEDVHSMPKMGVVGAFGFGRSKGVVEAVFAGAGLALHYVSPAKWKRDMGLTVVKGSSKIEKKGVARRRAIELWPAKAELFKLVKHDGRAEAALLALWYQQHVRLGS